MESDKIKSVSTIIFVGILVIVVGTIIQIFSSKFTQNAIETDATIIAIDGNEKITDRFNYETQLRHETNNDKDYESRSVNIKYKDLQGKEYTSRVTIDEYKNNLKYVGDKIVIYYSKDNPEKVKTKQDSFMGIGMIIAGIAIVIMGICIKHNKFDQYNNFMGKVNDTQKKVDKNGIVGIFTKK